MDQFNAFIASINGLLWHNYVLFTVLGAGLLFTLWSGFSQYRSLTHGVAVLGGRYKQPDAPGALSHFQALSAALSATVGLGNIGGVAIAIALGGPGAVFWMWVVGFLGMALKMAEVTLAMIYRNTDDPHNPHGGAMWVIKKAAEERGGMIASAGKFLGGLFCVTVLVFAFTGGNMFQAWNAGDISREYFGVPNIATGIILAVVVGAVILGGITRIGKVAGTLVPAMCGLYLLAGIYVLILHAGEIPATFGLIFESAFSPTEATGAFLGGSMGYAFLWGMKRALFSSEAGLGSAPMAHAAVQTREPEREGVVAGLEPFIDTLVVCTTTALVILVTGVWNRPAELELQQPPAFEHVAGQEYQLQAAALPPTTKLVVGTPVFMIAQGVDNADTNNNLIQVTGKVEELTEGLLAAVFEPINSAVEPTLQDGKIWANYVGATLTAKAFDSAEQGLGEWLITLAVWLFAISTMISWSYYGEQAMVYLFGSGSVTTYRVLYCLSAVLACTGFITSTAELGNFSDLGAGMMLVVNIPITLLLGHKAMGAYKRYNQRLKAGEFEQS
ncbi:MAG: amino acid carrier protein [Gammaproteobacteria bacterium]|nr:amino acid carrier protein [Gammaproteobacteria bacterium]